MDEWNQGAIIDIYPSTDPCPANYKTFQSTQYGTKELCYSSKKKRLYLGACNRRKSTGNKPKFYTEGLFFNFDPVKIEIFDG